MAEPTIKICMFGEFSFSTDTQVISDRDNRSGKVWLLLAYIICFRNKTISDDDIVSALWYDDDSNVNPTNALKTMFHRSRSLLDRVCDGCGRRLIIRKKGSYSFNIRADYTLDIEEFEKLYNFGKSSSFEVERLSYYMKALDLYKGDFIPKISSELWVMPLKTYYHNLYLQIVREAIDILLASGRHADIALICRKAIEIELFDENLYYSLMRSLLESKKHNEAVAVYIKMSDMLFSMFGVMPSDQLRETYREAMRTENIQETDLLTIKDQLKEYEQKTGAFLCDYDFFKVFYQIEARAIVRSGDAVHIGLLTITDVQGKPISKRSLGRSMDNLAKVICECLRQGDVVAKYSSSQYVLLLPHANSENSRMVLIRIVRTFRRQYPHFSANISFTIQPLDPTLPQQVGK